MRKSKKIDKENVRTGLYHSFENTVVKPFIVDYIACLTTRTSEIAIKYLINTYFIGFSGAKVLATPSNVCKP